jgi:flagellar assembly protein FliH
MPTEARKFLFETAFDPSGGPPPPPPRKHFTAAEYEAARRAADEAGRAAGREAARADAEARAAASLAKLVAASASAFAEIARRHERQGREAVGFAAEMVRRLFPAFAARHGVDEFAALLADCLRRLQDEPRVVVRVAEAAVDAIKARLEPAAAEAGFAGKLILLGDPALGDGDARIEWADGGVERAPQAVWAEIDEILQRHVAGATPAATNV